MTVLEEKRDTLDFESRVREVFVAYTNIICPFVITLEVIDNEYPIEIFNEIRSIFFHLSVFMKSEDFSAKESELIKAEGHLKRAHLDCYKYLSHSYLEYHRDFVKIYAHYDLRAVEDGQFIIDLSDLRKAAIEKYEYAKNAEAQRVEVDKLYFLFEESYNACRKLYIRIRDSEHKCQRLRKKHKVITTVNWVIGAIGVAGTIFGIITFFL
ncbi:MAG: hypothetical protein FWD35_05060 [Oscillospiraceae bacterium]|nr:hypothetical protein [Oscillospiraceae bacterium]